MRTIFLIFVRSQSKMPGIAEKAENTAQWENSLNRPWFNRVRIYQELMFSSELRIQCGVFRARWHQVRQMCQLSGFTNRIEPYKTFYTLDSH